MTDVQAQIETLEQQRADAMLRHDLPALGAMLDDAMIYIHSTALVDDKAAYVKLMQDGTLAYHTIDLGTPRVTQAGADVVFLDGVARMDIDWYGARKALHNVFICSWVRRPHGWRFLTWQSTAIPKPAA